MCTPRQVRAGVPAILDAITYRALHGQAADAPLRAQTPAGLAMALRMVQRPSYQMERPEEEGPPVRTRGASPDGTRGTPGPASGTGSRCCAPRYDAGPYPGVSRVRTRSWPSASSSVGSRGPVSFPISSW